MSFSKQSKVPWLVSYFAFFFILSSSVNTTKLYYLIHFNFKRWSQCRKVQKIEDIHDFCMARAIGQPCTLLILSMIGPNRTFALRWWLDIESRYSSVYLYHPLCWNAYRLIWYDISCSEVTYFSSNFCGFQMCKPFAML